MAFLKIAKGYPKLNIPTIVKPATNALVVRARRFITKYMQLTSQTEGIFQRCLSVIGFLVRRLKPYHNYNSNIYKIAFNNIYHGQ